MRRTIVLMTMTAMGCMAGTVEVPGDELETGTRPRNVFELKGNRSSLRLEGSPSDPSFLGTYPNPDEVGYMKVIVQPSGLLDARCLVGRDELPCVETPFLTQVKDRQDGSRLVTVSDVGGNQVAVLRFNAGQVPKGQTELPPGLEPLGRGWKQPPPDDAGGASPPPSVDPCSEGVLRQRLCDNVNSKLTAGRTGAVMSCDALTVPPGSRTGTPRPGNLETLLRWCASFVEEAYVPLVLECPGSGTDLINWGMSAREELIFQGVCQHSPLVLDLDGDGVQPTSLARGTSFDLLAVGEPVQCAWVRGDDALLVRDLNRNGRVDDGSELFGQATGGGAFADGFAALRALDANGDGVVDSADPVYHELLVWNDVDGDGESQASELRGLREAGVRSLDLAPRTILGAAALDAHGNRIPLQGSFERFDGGHGALVDVFFRFRP